VIESEVHAKKRGAEIKGRLLGYGHSTDTHHITQPEPNGFPLEAAMRQAFDRAGLQPADIGYINAHGTGTPFNDGAEAAAFARVFPMECRDLRISSTKAAIGHTLGAAGALEAVFSLLALKTGMLPPQINTNDPVEAVDGRLAVSGSTLTKKAVLSVNLGFGGSNAAVIFTAE
jgi:3-oxoacyl-[acyl-carrier-protein] synthase II